MILPIFYRFAQILLRRSDVASAVRNRYYTVT